jgi:hypothetical protein
MLRLFGSLILGSSLLLATTPADGNADEELKKKPITSDSGEVGKLLQKWWQEGTAAGNVGDWYDNRDGDHSPLDLRPYPQLQKIPYTDEDIKARRHWALTVATRPQVTFGNSSTSSSVTQGGSNPRHAYCTPRGPLLLAQQYRSNNVYIYPEHRDHDPGHNGWGDGYGDLYPTNTPYLLISQGSSGSDQAFMRAIPFTLAAFRPEVKQKLIDSGLLMPTMQMILRSTNKHLTGPKDYLSDKAHPSVFEGSWVDALKMVKLAHEITAETIPPLVQLKVLEESSAENGRDYFELPGVTERLADTPAVIARVWRGKERRRRLVVSAADSFDLNKKPLTWTWVVLRGDDKQIQIMPRNEEGSEVEIVVPYHPRRPVTPGSSLESNRVDIGVFAHNGTYHSAPGFITYFTLDNESRAYDEQGRILEIAYGAGEVDVRVSNHSVLFSQLAAAEGLPAQLLKLSADQRAALEQVGVLYERQRQLLEILRAKAKETEAARAKKDAELKAAQVLLATTRKAHADRPSDETKVALEKATRDVEELGASRKPLDDAVKAAQKETTDRQKKLEELLAVKQAELGVSVNGFVDRTLRRIWQDPDFFDAHGTDILAALEKASPARKSAIGAVRQRLIQMGLAKDGAGGRLRWQPIREGDAPLAVRLTPYEKQLLERFQATLLAELVLPGAVTVSVGPNYVDQRLFAPRLWRDVYHYDTAGQLAGWTRYEGSRVTDYTPEGMMVLQEDSAGRPVMVQSVRYQQTPAREPGRPNTLEPTPGEEIVTYAYEDGKRVEKTRAPR